MAGVAVAVGVAVGVGVSFGVEDPFKAIMTAFIGTDGPLFTHCGLWGAVTPLQDVSAAAWVSALLFESADRNAVGDAQHPPEGSVKENVILLSLAPHAPAISSLFWLSVPKIGNVSDVIEGAFPQPRTAGSSGFVVSTPL